MSASPIVERVVSQDGRFRVEICRHRDGHFQVHLERWTVEIAEGYGVVAEFWEEVTTAASIIDEFGIARAIADGLLRRHAST